MEIFKEYIAMWKNYVNFSDRTTVRGYWMAVLWNAVAAAVCSLIDRLIGGDGSTIVAGLYSLAVLLPGIAIVVRRLRDSGTKWSYIFIALIPLVGWILMIVKMCKASAPDDGTPVV